MAERGMGRGLSAILGATAAVDGNLGLVGDDRLVELTIDTIEPNPGQPRQSFDEDQLQALAESIIAQGVLQPVLVRPRDNGHYELVAGERRWRAARLAGLTKLPAIVRKRGDAESLQAALVENIAREDLNPVEQARAVAALVEELGLTREQVGKRIGRSRVAVSNLLRLLDLPDDVLDLLSTRRLSEGHGRALLLASDNVDRRNLGRSAADDGWSVRETERRARAVADKAKPKERKQETPHPDQLAAASEIAETIGRVLGIGVAVSPYRSGYRVVFELDSPDDAHDLARRLGHR